jgi:hypothetical protein
MQQLPKELAAAVLLQEPLELGDRLSARTACRQPLQVAAALTVRSLQAYGGELPARAWELYPVARQLVVGYAGLPPTARPCILDLLRTSVHVPKRLEKLIGLIAGVLSVDDSRALVDTLASRLCNRTLVHLSLSTAITTAAADALLRHFARLEELRLIVHSLADGDAQQFLLPWAPQLPRTLRALHMESTETTDGSPSPTVPTVHLDLAALSHLQALTHLQLKSCRLFNASSLSALRSLQTMDKLSCPVPQVRAQQRPPPPPP